MALIRFSKPALYRKDMDSVLQAMVDEKIGPGERKRLFVSLFAERAGKKGGFALRSYYDAIKYSLLSLSLEKGDGIAISVLTPKIYLEVLKELELKPIILDTDKEMIINSEEIAASIDVIKAIIVYEPMCQVPSNKETLASLELPIIEDISQSLGSVSGEFKAGTLGKIVIALTEEENIVSTGGGAVVLTSDEAVIDRLKRAIASIEAYISMPDLNAALGIVQLSKLDEILERRRSIYEIYLNASRKSKARAFGSASTLFASNGYGFAVVVNTHPDEAIELFKRYQIVSQRPFKDFIGSKYLDKFDRFPNAIAALQRAIAVPLYPFLSSMEVDTIQKVLSHLR